MALHQKLKLPHYTPQEFRETHRIILSAHNARQTDAPLPTTVDMSSPQAYEAGPTRQPAESESRAFSSDHSTTLEPMGTDTGSLRRRATSSYIQEFEKALAQWPSNENPSFHDSLRTDPASFTYRSAFKCQLPVSFEYARQAAERLIPDVSQRPFGASSASAESVEQVEGPIQGELRTFSQWPRLGDQPPPPPTVGDMAYDLSGFTDSYGVKGTLLLTTFINMEDLSCRVCSFKAGTVQLAVLHQQVTSHFQT